MNKNTRAFLLAAATLLAAACGDHIACETQTDVARSCAESSYSGLGAQGAADGDRRSCESVGGKLVASCATVAVAACDLTQNGGNYTVATTTYSYTGTKATNDKFCVARGGTPR